MQTKINKKLINKAKKWLGKNGIKFFRDVQTKYGKIATACWMHEGIPHPVHFREGMQVRNWLRTNSDWDFDRIENHWDELINQLLKRNTK